MRGPALHVLALLERCGGAYAAAFTDGAGLESAPADYCSNPFTAEANCTLALHAQVGLALLLVVSVAIIIKLQMSSSCARLPPSAAQAGVSKTGTTTSHCGASARGLVLLLLAVLVPPCSATEVGVTWRGELLDEVDYGQRLTINNGRSWDNGRVHYEDRLETYGIRLPMVGTTDINTDDSNTLVLDQRTKVYLLRMDSWRSVDLTGWTDMGIVDSLLGDSSKRGSVKIYYKTLEAGTYVIDNDSAMYLFDIPTQSAKCEVVSISNPWRGRPRGTYFRLSAGCGACVKGQLWPDRSSGTTVAVEQERDGSIIWRGTVIVWQGPGSQSYAPAISGQFYSGRRDPSASAGLDQWAAGDFLHFAGTAVCAPPPPPSPPSPPLAPLPQVAACEVVLISNQWGSRPRGSYFRLRAGCGACV